MSQIDMQLFNTWWEIWWEPRWQTAIQYLVRYLMGQNHIQLFSTCRDVSWATSANNYSIPGEIFHEPHQQTAIQIPGEMFHEPTSTNSYSIPWGAISWATSTNSYSIPGEIFHELRQTAIQYEARYLTSQNHKQLFSTRRDISRARTTNSYSIPGERSRKPQQQTAIQYLARYRLRARTTNSYWIQAERSHGLND